MCLWETSELEFLNPEFYSFFCLFGKLVAIYRDSRVYIFDLLEHVYWLLQLKRGGTWFWKSTDIMVFQVNCVSDPHEDFWWCFQLYLGFFVPSVATNLYFSFIGVSVNRLMGGAMQLTFRKMAFDYYPFHWAGRRILNGGMVLAWLRYLEQIPGFTPDCSAGRCEGLQHTRYWK